MRKLNVALSISGLAAVVILVNSVFLEKSRAVGGNDPSSVRITVYGMAISQNSDCSDAKVVSTFPGGKEFEFMDSPTLMGGQIPEGNYPCVIMKMSTAIKYSPASNTGSCVAGEDYSRVVCSAANGNCRYTPVTFNDDKTVTFGDLTNSQATNSSDISNAPVAAVFLTTGSIDQNGSFAFMQPTAANNAIAVSNGEHVTGLPLSGALSVIGDKMGTFTADFHGKIEGNNSECDVAPPRFAFE